MHGRKKNRKIVIVDILIGFIMAFVVAISSRYFIPNFKFLSQVDKSMLLNIIVTQYTITFLIVSLLSLLSARGEYIYWVDVLEQKIIAPKHLNFISMSIYAFITMLVGTIAFFMDDVKLVLIYFVIDVICLVFLTFRMIDIFFGRERMQNRLQRKIIKEIKNYLYNPDDDKLKRIEERLYGMYENANKLAEGNEFAQIIETDFQLLVDISELMKEKYNNNLAKVIYSNIGKLLLIFQGNSDFIFHILYERYQPFGNQGLCRHTLEMIQSALFDFFERVLAKGEYSVSQNYWLSRIYNNLTKTFDDMWESMNNTLLIVEMEHHNYEGEILFEEEACEQNLVDYNLRDMKLNLVHDKLIRFIELLYKNSPNTLFHFVSQNGMPSVLIKEMDFLGKLCECDKLNNAEKALHKICRQNVVFVKEQEMKKLVFQISAAMGDETYQDKQEELVNEETCAVSEMFKELYRDTAMRHKSLAMTNVLLKDFESIFWDYKRTIMRRRMSKTSVQAFMEPEVPNTRELCIKDEEFYEVLKKSKELFKDDDMFMKLYSRIEKFFG